jgi:hypothetical protein
LINDLSQLQKADVLFWLFVLASYVFNFSPELTTQPETLAVDYFAY